MVFSALTFGQEVELIWRQRWSLMTFLYLIVRYAGIAYAVMVMLGRIINNVVTWIGAVVNAILGVIIIVQLHAMYQRSRKVLIFLVVIFLAIIIANVVMLAMQTMQISVEELVLFGIHQCAIGYAGDTVFLASMTWILATVWEVLALCFAVWVAVKHFRELRQHSTRGIIGDCFTVLMKTHVSYFASFLAITCFQIGFLSPTLSEDSYSLDTHIYLGLSQILQVVQMFVLGPRLILGVREYHAELVANSDTATAMTSITFQKHIHISTNSSV
ncbi:hypothetical protein BDR03DRAFT_1094854 [Suillus americanus]|nr:hypothetical protein BDR03DRAFT_1094854 [Suillus americanus]